MTIRSPFVSKKKLTEMQHAAFNSFFGALFGRGRADYSKQLDDPTGSSLIMAVLLWVARRWLEAPLYLEDSKGDAVYKHPLIDQLAKPNPYYSGTALWFGVVMSFAWDGNGYIVKVRNKRDLSIRELWYVPHFQMEPMVNQNSGNFIDYYQYSPSGISPLKLDSSDVVHLRYGIDPHNPRKGFSPLKSIARDAATDEEADNFAASMLHNMGVPGLLFTPDFSAGQVANFDADAAKKYIKEHFSGDNRGQPMVNSGPTKVQQFGFDPKSMDLAALRGIPEERVSAVSGIPAAVIGFGSGLAQTKVGATMKELREMAYEDGVIPLQRLIGAGIETQLLDEYEPNPEGWRVRFDLSQVRVLQDDQDALYKRTSEAWTSGIISREQAKQALGFDTTDADKIRRVPFAMTEVPDGISLDEITALSSSPMPGTGTLPLEAVPATEIQATALNGAQVAALVDLAVQVTQGTLPLASAQAIAASAFPMATPADLSAIFSPLAGFASPKPPQIIPVGAVPPEPPKARHAQTKGASRERAFLAAQTRDEDRLSAAYASELESFFEDTADRAAAAYESIKARAPSEQKADEPTPEEEAEILAETARVMQAIEAAKPLEGSVPYQKHYYKTYTETVGNMEAVFGIDFNLPDLVQRDVLARGGKHIALVRIREQTQEAIFRAITEGRTKGLGPKAIARQIRANTNGMTMYPGIYAREYDLALSAGASKEAAGNAADLACRRYRSETIARTETKYAQNVSTLESAKASGTFDAMLAFDNQRGFNDADCIERNGKTFSFEEAEVELEQEHPRGTLSFSPTIRGGA